MLTLYLPPKGDIRGPVPGMLLGLWFCLIFLYYMYRKK